MNVNSVSPNFKGKYKVDPTKVKTGDQMISLGYIVAMSKNDKEVFNKLVNTNMTKEVVFDIPDIQDKEAEGIMQESGIKFSKLA